jgi:hypothetical protein
MYFTMSIREPVHCPSCGRQSEPTEVGMVVSVFTKALVAVVIDCADCGVRFIADAQGRPVRQWTAETLREALEAPQDEMQELERTLENPQAAMGLLRRFREADGDG